MAITLNTSGVFDNIPFAQGRFRRAYMGTYTAPPEKYGHKCVVKDLKEKYTWNPLDWNTTLAIHREAQGLAAGFNTYINIPGLITFTNAEVQQVSGNPNPHRRPMVNEYVVVADYIPGQFKKWLNNYGYISPEVSEAKAMPAFAHWSWCHTKGEKMIADLQGVRSVNLMGTMSAYTLTDPVLMSCTVDGGHYGCTDTGVEGIAMFFINHQCNELCNNLPKPTAQALGIPQSQIDLVRGQIIPNTTYSHEKKLSDDMRKHLVGQFRAIAQGFQYSCYN